MIDCMYILQGFPMLMFLLSRWDDKERPRARQSHSVLTMLLPLIPLLALISSASAFLQASCEFQGEGTGEVRGLLILNEYDTPDGSEIE